MKLLLALITLFVLSVVVGTIVIGSRHFEGLVTDRPFEKGLAWDEEQEARAELGLRWKLENERLTVGANELLIRVHAEAGTAGTPIPRSLTVSRPATVQHDRVYELESFSGGFLPVAVDFPLHGHWDLKLSVETEKGLRVLQKRIYVEKGEGKQASTGTDCRPDTGPCTGKIDLNDITVLFDIDPKPVRAMAELRFRVTLREPERPVSDAAVTLDLSMPGMFMGPNRPILQHTGDGMYEGTGIIPRCPSGRKLWKAEITAARGERSGTVSYIFEVP